MFGLRCIPGTTATRTASLSTAEDTLAVYANERISLMTLAIAGHSVDELGTFPASRASGHEIQPLLQDLVEPRGVEFAAGGKLVADVDGHHF